MPSLHSIEIHVALYNHLCVQYVDVCVGGGACSVHGCVRGCAFTSSLQICISDHTTSTHTAYSMLGFFAGKVHILVIQHLVYTLCQSVCVLSYKKYLSLCVICICVCGRDVSLFASCHSFSLSSAHSAVA